MSTMHYIQCDRDYSWQFWGPGFAGFKMDAMSEYMPGPAVSCSMTRQQHEAWKMKRSLDGADVSANQVWENQFYNDKVKMQLVQIIMVFVDT